MKLHLYLFGLSSSPSLLLHELLHTVDLHVSLTEGLDPPPIALRPRFPTGLTGPEGLVLCLGDELMALLTAVPHVEAQASELLFDLVD